MAGQFFYPYHWVEIADSIDPDLQLDEHTGMIEKGRRGLLGDRAIEMLTTRDRYLEDFVFGSQQSQTTHVHRSTNQSIPTYTGTNTIVTFDTVDYDDLGIWSAGAPDRLTIKVAGSYTILAYLTFANNNAGTIRSLNFFANGNLQLGIQISPVQTFATPLTITAPWRFNAGDYIQIGVAQDSGGALNLVASNPIFLQVQSTH